jgi:hypothetical protein
MIRFRRKQPPLLPFTVVALSHNETPIRIGVLAHSQADAMETARELFPQHLISTAALEPEWQEDPA